VDVKLKVLRGPHEGKEIPLSGSKFLIGRSEDCDLRPNSDMISRHHCVIMVDGSYIEIRDFGSKNGTFVNGQQVTAPLELRPGDHLKAGPLEFEVTVEQRVGGKKRAPVKGVADVVARTVNSPGNSDENDIDDWLVKSPEDEAQQSAMRETQTLSAGDTGVIAARETPAETPQSVGDAETEESNEAVPEEKSSSRRKGKKKQEPGKLPPIPKKDHGDSSNAAANVLRDMMRRR
jgi:pSer/pThr/pTyr-binding forkhead associated (FHA) protein